MQYGFSLNPHEILGIGEEASLEELRNAYHEKAKRYHPDRGGDAWAFRLVCRAYEILGTARVAGRAATETVRPAPGPDPTPTPKARPATGSANAKSEWTRTGIRDAVDHPSKLVDVETFLLRYAITDPMQILFGTTEDRVLSCNLNVSWPSKAHAPNWREDDDSPVLALVSNIFAPLARKTRAIGSQAQVENGRFHGWLSYPSEKKVKEALQYLHKAFLAKGLGIEQWTREMIVPREDS
ncbi:MAG: DnaJ-class molecular chaperone with C-terminal Zn finger domain [Planctomycetota bacterium]|nr:DnaJ-class molecular chaperone with C-terminal Zn finger domain [Planctomycetota bacterium]